MWFVADVNWPGGALNDQMNAFFLMQIIQRHVAHLANKDILILVSILKDVSFRSTFKFPLEDNDTHAVMNLPSALSFTIEPVY